MRYVAIWGEKLPRLPEVGISRTKKSVFFFIFYFKKKLFFIALIRDKLLKYIACTCGLAVPAARRGGKTTWLVVKSPWRGFDGSRSSVWVHRYQKMFLREPEKPMHRSLEPTVLYPFPVVLRGHVRYHGRSLLEVWGHVAMRNLFTSSSHDSIKLSSFCFCRHEG